MCVRSQFPRTSNHCSEKLASISLDFCTGYVLFQDFLTPFMTDMCHFRGREKSRGWHFSEVFVIIPYCTRSRSFSGNCARCGAPSQDFRIIASLALGREGFTFF